MLRISLTIDSFSPNLKLSNVQFRVLMPLLGLNRHGSKELLGLTSQRKHLSVVRKQFTGYKRRSSRFAFQPEPRLKANWTIGMIINQIRNLLSRTRGEPKGDEQKESLIFAIMFSKTTIFCISPRHKAIKHNFSPLVERFSSETYENARAAERYRRELSSYELL